MREMLRGAFRVGEAFRVALRDVTTCPKTRTRDRVWSILGTLSSQRQLERPSAYALKSSIWTQGRSKNCSGFSAIQPSALELSGQRDVTFKTIHRLA